MQQARWLVKKYGRLIAVLAAITVIYGTPLLRPLVDLPYPYGGVAIVVFDVAVPLFIARYLLSSLKRVAEEKKSYTHAEATKALANSAEGAEEGPDDHVEERDDNH